ncbi:cobalamin biosynthesis protein [Nocardia cyriacigeorgica]|jgi:cobalt-precorrin 5A hydrolase|uniref:cobalamin biosynthesis protein n=1 Tax=Nocardia cyriacigeorgica TaxID=135487 RepID=UPI0018956EBA|nr:cobalamin biosynthesis protein [Nocardia cyriacigeorgica]MBF6456929.1 cobalamin biosynthesis protein [Nocardia cyriacigeorgica]MBF6478368.1 cobalamin biosynthesis protein [Nocardia cyriacigeorgica]MBF6551734.1 cobalamin biosynthesis protein [Nocardia cyriacigeorgica]
MPPDEPFDAAAETRRALAVGVGIRPGTPAAQIIAAIRAVIGPHPVACLATIDRRATEPGFRSAAAELGVPVYSFTTAELSSVQVPNPSARTTTALGVPGVAEAAALLAGTGPLLFPRQVIGTVVIAAACPGPVVP